ncbi:NADH:ubiquinone oxidoreductase, Na(+)-translocating, A subunit [Saprospira grandis DSM 2844]|uniref:Na(+)-translocating NADH-quinone reductase subunit A n=1 Tax=Saprospira grandis DSM 2844 TaxID=694433 RepID=J0XTT6_9BACT|nr:NADH:ubiquinone reductase (Na(+)-transporting) subunit A [Saprospira grandis]EJF52361.1 NADH:ubiquinone oxidoreductase, Na(+)-translocating, A subunit [Saprospira grandis DSM 2844]
MTWGIIIAIVLVLFIFTLLTLGDGLLKVTASQAGEDTSGYSVLPTSLQELLGLGKKKGEYVPDDAPVKRLKRGFDVNLAGGPSLGQAGIRELRSATYALKPKDLIGMSPIPKVMPELGATVKAGEPLFYDKKHPEIIYAAPVSGEFIELRRGEKRSINELVILADQGEMQYHKHEDVPNLETASRADLVDFLTASGAWPFLRQRPFDIVADPSMTPKSIFVSTFDTAPWATDANFSVAGKEAAFRKGLAALAMLSGTKVHLGVNGMAQERPSDAFLKADEVEGVELHYFQGQHPAGNVGVHIHHVDPVLPNGQVVWHTDVHGVLLIGQLLLEGIFDTSKVIAVGGAELPAEEGYYARVHQGIHIAALLEGMADDMTTEKAYVRNAEGQKEEKMVEVRSIRIVSGDLLSGKQVERESFLGFYDDQLSVVKEGNYYELFGWLVPQAGHPTRSRTFPGGFFPGTHYVPDTNTNGEKRAFVMTGEYESVLPMNIYPQHVMRAILAKDFEKMEGLGLLELGEEDIALCEYVCTSKQPLQAILREGLEELRAQ